MYTHDLDDLEYLYYSVFVIYIDSAQNSISSYYSSIFYKCGDQTLNTRLSGVEFVRMIQNSWDTFDSTVKDASRRDARKRFLWNTKQVSNAIKMFACVFPMFLDFRWPTIWGQGSSNGNRGQTVYEKSNSYFSGSILNRFHWYSLSNFSKLFLAKTSARWTNETKWILAKL